MLSGHLREMGDPFHFLYGTHSFRRGGVQFFHCCCNWDLKKLCDWGGWSLSLDNLTIVRYLVHENDEPSLRRDGYLRNYLAPSKVFKSNLTLLGSR